MTGSPVWVSNRDGAALQFGTASALTFFPDTGDQVWLPTTAVTVAFIRRRTSASLGSFVVTQTRGGKLDIYAPFSDGTVYWDFGGQSSPNRLSVSGLSFTNALITPERWIFSAGPQGSAIWRDGVKLASQATAITRASDSAETLILNSTDYNEFNFVQMHTVQWSDDLCRWWSAEPYAHLYPRPMTYIGSSHGKGKLPAGIIGATAPSAGASGTGPLCTTLGVG